MAVVEGLGEAVNFSTHLTGGILAGVLVASALHSNDGTTAIGVAVATLAALVPDRVQYSVKSIRMPLEGHRGVSHSLIFAFATTLLVNPLYALYWLAGLVSHYILDLPSDAGLPLFWPLYRRRVALGLWRNGGRAEAVTRGLLCGACVFVVMTWL